MRLVSQNGTVDCNYENGNLSIGCVRHEDGTEDVLSDDKVVELLKNWNMQAITVANSDTTRCDYINNTVFRFPADENVEVEDEVERS